MILLNVAKGKGKYVKLASRIKTFRSTTDCIYDGGPI